MPLLHAIHLIIEITPTQPIPPKAHIPNRDPICPKYRLILIIHERARNHIDPQLQPLPMQMIRQPYQIRKQTPIRYNPPVIISMVSYTPPGIETAVGVVARGERGGEDVTLCGDVGLIECESGVDGLVTERVPPAGGGGETVGGCGGLENCERDGGDGDGLSETAGGDGVFVCVSGAVVEWLAGEDRETHGDGWLYVTRNEWRGCARAVTTGVAGSAF